jgi:hypothetical protein
VVDLGYYVHKLSAFILQLIQEIRDMYNEEVIEAVKC